VHRDGILFTTTVPGPNVSDESALKAQQAAQAIVAELGYVGVLCIEFFVLTDGSLVVNEMAPRPHNSGHYTIDACVTSQFAQQVRAMARLPLGDVRQHSPSVMLNILGDVWFDGDQVREPAWDQILALPGANLHLYGKDDPRRGRKMGHVTFVAPTVAEAQRQFEAACAILGIAP
jgi:5-(carboxyamino)imidazole ribonucleotide synthase